MTCEELVLLIDIRDFTTLFFVVLRRESSKWLESFIESDLGMRLFKSSFWCKNMLFKKVHYLLIFLIRENEILILVISDLLFVSTRELCQRPPSPVRTSNSTHLFIFSFLQSPEIIFVEAR